MFAQVTDSEYPPASMLNRTAAFTLDVLLVIILVFSFVEPNLNEIIELANSFYEQASESSHLKKTNTQLEENNSTLLWLVFSSSPLPLLFYFTMAEILLGGTTLGKKVFNLRTAYRDSPRIPPVGQTFIRSLLKTISFISVGSIILFFLVGNYIIAFFRKDRRTLHDILTKTSVVPGFLPDPEEEHRYH